MTSLLHHHFHGTDSEALSYLRDDGWTSRMATPAPGVHLTGGTVLLVLAGCSAVSLGRHVPAAGIVVGVVGFVIALLDLLPALWSLTHREYAGQYLAARNAYGDGRQRLHPAVVLVALPALAFVAVAAAPAHADVGSRLLWGLLAAAVGLALGLLRVALALRTNRAFD